MVNDFLASQPPHIRRAVDLVASMIRIYGGRDGTGLFAGVGRYTVLQARLRLCAETSRDVAMFWDRMARRMCWPIASSKHYDVVLSLIQARGDDAATLEAFALRSHAVVMIAHSIVRGERPDYVAAPDAPTAAEPDLNDSIADIFDRPSIGAE